MLLYFGSLTILTAVPELMCDVDHRASPAFVSRGGIKLENAILASALDVAGRRALDVGASTGGFTDCLLRRGAAEVIAVDVGYGQLAWTLRNDPRVSVLERTNARGLTGAMLPYTPDLVDDRRVVHLARARSCRRCWRAWRTHLTCWRWSSPNSRSAVRRVGKGGVVRDAGCSSRRARERRRGRARAGDERARLSLLGTARAQGQPRDVRPRSPRPAAGARRTCGSLRRWLGSVEP